jgi:hypothetical protein
MFDGNKRALNATEDNAGNCGFRRYSNAAAAKKRRL